ncbi:hypothetical protein [Planktothricoides raciborskii]|uniref:Transposase n=1 Tax=Planktothricoides raciborskii FACHB-1370 TaxID=2949576 RepID=A0ABR8EAL7_9CYAN|nr:hypothetical protein [Planktothricoides raciborskii]MBD2543224.1 hypothetical protein [Planktothricoides raciborskii FACHB-1370]MBD2580860.1 hypothetical protein [Planktothricoides raciborskii FACHB-1261]
MLKLLLAMGINSVYKLVIELLASRKRSQVKKKENGNLLLGVQTGN